MEYAITVKNVWKMLGYKWILKNISLKIPNGSLAYIYGSNGSGKSTFLKMTGGLWRPTKGKINVLGLNPMSKDAKRVLGIVVHENILYDELSVAENLRFYMEFYGLKNFNHLKKIMNLLGINKVLNKKVKELSFGWKRRINIARALINSPKILIIDEPLTGLDDDGRAAVIEIIHEIVREGGTVVAASPDVEEELVRGVNHIIYHVINKNIMQRGNFS